MAVMHPIDIENYNYTDTEREMYYALKNQLPDKFHVFYSIRWFETINSKRVDSESDFLIFDPNFGFITMEVKGGIGIEINDGVWTLIEGNEHGSEKSRTLKCSPFEQAEKSMRHFYNYFYDEFDQSFNGVYGFSVAFPRYSVPERVANEAAKELILDLTDMNNLQHKINSIFHYWRNKRNLRAPFSQDQKSRFINAINKRVALSAAAGALIPIKEREFTRLNIVQDSIIDALYNYRQAFIVGGAGTGKTWIGIKKVVRAAQKNKKALYLCISEELANYVYKKVPHELPVECVTFENLMKTELKDDFYLLPTNEEGEHLFFDNISNKKLKKLYDTIVVDEAQDFNVDMALSIRCFMKHQTESELYVLFDKNQNIFDRDFEDGFSIDYPPFVLRYNIRNTGNIYEWAINNTGLGEETIANTLLGVAPEYMEFKNRSQAKKQLNNIINRLIQKEYVSNKSVVLLSNVVFEKSILVGEEQIGAYKISDNPLELIQDGEVCFRTTNDFKGLEADIVIFLRQRNNSLPISHCEKQSDYVAYTRARYYLYVFDINAD